MEFTPWPKTPRLFRDAVITEKIDGTNAAVVVEAFPFGTHAARDVEPSCLNIVQGTERDETGMPVYEFAVGAQSRSRLLTLASDNFGFARWVNDNSAALAHTLGEGTHYGEWWGSGIQRGYGLTNGDRRFSLFNVHRYADAVEGSEVPGLGVVPVLYTGPFDTLTVSWVINELESSGSHAAPGFMRPEGVVVFHSASRSVFKALIENDDKPKGN